MSTKAYKGAIAYRKGQTKGKHLRCQVSRRTRIMVGKETGAHPSNEYKVVINENLLDDAGAGQQAREDEDGGAGDHGDGDGEDDAAARVVATAADGHALVLVLVLTRHDESRVGETESCRAIEVRINPSYRASDERERDGIEARIDRRSGCEVLGVGGAAFSTVQGSSADRRAGRSGYLMGSRV